MAKKSVVERILNMARWAPSGDNTQPWRFEIIGPSHVVIHGSDTRDHVVYDLCGHGSQLALGTLIETLCLAAGEHGLSATVKRRIDVAEETPTFDVFFEAAVDTALDPLVDQIQRRSVQRRGLSMRRISPADKRALEATIGPGFRVIWLDSVRKQLEATWLRLDDAGLRLTLPEAYAVHAAAIEWKASTSIDRIPDKSIGANPFVLPFMRWGMKSIERQYIMNRYLAGTFVARFELDLLPALRCGAHFAICANEGSDSIDSRIAAGRAIQRFWLAATAAGLQMQPEMTPLIFSKYIRDGVKFSKKRGAKRHAQRLAARFSDLVGLQAAESAVFLGRIGYGKVAKARSLRLPLKRLVVAPLETAAATHSEESSNRGAHRSDRFERAPTFANGVHRGAKERKPRAAV